ncbi:hypothetical protein BJ508DRAFT_313626 [Ascobolus immersus RN42]|uniref:Uncharacterized protein n=1 Tax=Ascobolus immersus RN42 TaxID=1160509 RepID=A0A3N4HNL1_ASCIM|nr:hypothetical protein BJ508DRAFT_313626 [Ascobolus immersus RN42]
MSDTEDFNIYVSFALVNEVRTVTMTAFRSVMPQITCGDFHKMVTSQDSSHHTNLISRKALRELLSDHYDAGTPNTIIELATCITETTEVLFKEWVKKLHEQWAVAVPRLCTEALFCKPEEVDVFYPASKALGTARWNQALAQRDMAFEEAKEKALKRAYVGLRLKRGGIWAPSMVIDTCTSKDTS